MRRALAVVLAVSAVAGTASADDACERAVIDPIVTPVRDIDLDAQRSACLRSELSAGLGAHALIDTPGFYGSLGGALTLRAQFVVLPRLELFAQDRVLDVSFVQNAVNQVTDAGIGPLVVGAAYGLTAGARARTVLAARLEVPYTRDHMDKLHTSGGLDLVFTGDVADTLVLHSRLGALGMHAESTAGSTNRFALRAGADLAWQLRSRFALVGGAEMSAGWYHGFDHLLLRAGIHWRMPRESDWRLRAGVGAPVGGRERANAILDVALVHGI
jgi:hypothetical protein